MCRDVVNGAEKMDERNGKREGLRQGKEWAEPKFELLSCIDTRSSFREMLMTN